MANIDLSLPYVLANEGGFVNNPHDHGGATNFGITRDTYARWIGSSVSVDDVKNMPLEDVNQIYYAYYWSPLNLDQIKDQTVATAIFDMGVNFGIHRGAMLAQAAVNDLNGNLQVDGMLGPKSCAAVNNCLANKFISSFTAEVKKRYQAIVDNNPSQSVFYKGWMNRANKLLTLA